MAIYHMCVRPIRRSSGQSAVTAAAYRSGNKYHCPQTGRRHDYSGRTDVDYSVLVGWSGDRETLWVTAETLERRKDANTAREYVVALPVELEPDTSIRLAQRFSHWLWDHHQVAVDLCIHGLESANPHAHVMTTTRASDGMKLGQKVAREWSGTKRKNHGLLSHRHELRHTRMMWGEMVNDELEQAHVVARVDHRSYAELYGTGVDAPVPTIHLGPAAVRMERSGLQTARGELNRAIQEIRVLDKEVERLHGEILATLANDEDPRQDSSPSPDTAPEEEADDWGDDQEDALDAQDVDEYWDPESHEEYGFEEEGDADHHDDDDLQGLE